MKTVHVSQARNGDLVARVHVPGLYITYRETGDGGIRVEGDPVGANVNTHETRVLTRQMAEQAIASWTPSHLAIHICEEVA